MLSIIGDRCPLVTKSNAGRLATRQMLTAQPAHHRGGVEEDREETVGLENAKEHITVPITVRVRSPLVKC